MAKVEELPNIEEWEQKEGEGWQEYDERIDDLYEELKVESDKVLSGEKHGLVGYIFRWQIADGYAMYLVAQEKPLVLQHIPYMDAYQLPPAHERGLHLSDIKASFEWEKNWRNP